MRAVKPDVCSYKSASNTKTVYEEMRRRKDSAHRLSRVITLQSQRWDMEIQPAACHSLEPGKAKPLWL